MVKNLIKKAIRTTGNLIGYDIAISKKQSKQPTKQSLIFKDNLIRINIGAGNWGLEGWTNLDYPSEQYKNAQSRHAFIPYDIRSDLLPFDANSVDMAYCSHVVEHIEDNYDVKLFRDSCRVLKPGGVLRIACPDAEFLYRISKWEWNIGNG